MFILVLIFIVIVICAVVFLMKKENKYSDDVFEYLKNLPYEEMTIDELSNMEDNSQFDGFLGVYVLMNSSKNIYYVCSFENAKHGKNKRGFTLKEDVLCHFIGKGHYKIKKDYDNGDKFSVRFVRYADRFIPTLKEFEKWHMDMYGSARTGYNK